MEVYNFCVLNWFGLTDHKSIQVALKNFNEFSIVFIWNPCLQNMQRNYLYVWTHIRSPRQEYEELKNKNFLIVSVINVFQVLFEVFYTTVIIKIFNNLSVASLLSWFIWWWSTILVEMWDIKTYKVGTKTGHRDIHTYICTYVYIPGQC